MALPFGGEDAGHPSPCDLRYPPDPPPKQALPYLVLTSSSVTVIMNQGGGQQV